jgi:hypothetical protein
MDKIKGLLTQIGASEDLAKQLCEELESYDQQIQEKYEGVYKTKLDQAKTICVEEVKKYKVDLARKVRVFLEGKSSQVEKRLDQQRAIEEGEAKAQLRKVKEITENIEVADDAELQALRSKLEKLETKNVQLAEDKKKAMVAANRANKIALEVLERSNRQVVSEEDSKPAEDTKEDTKDTKSKEVVAEEKKIAKKKTEDAKKKALKEDVKKKKVKQAKPKTTRRTLTESQSPKTAKKQPGLGIEADNDILDIAQTID